MTTAPAQQLLDRLDGVKQTPNGHQAKCPNHDDKHASLSVSRGDDGTCLIRCHAGCSAADIVGAVGLSMKDLFPPANGTAKGRIVATYDYTGADGALLYQVVRKDPKDFRQRTPDGRGGWSWKLNGAKRVLYHLPEIVKADPAEPVLVVEGEKDCDRLRGLGFIATTNSGGASKWKTEYSETLRGRTVIVIPDNDGPGGKHADTVARSCHGVASVVKVVSLPGLKEHGDVSSWLDAGGTVEQLRDLAAAADLYVPTDSPKDEPESNERVNRVLAVQVSTVESQPIEWLWNKRLALGKLTMLAGDPGLGKSFTTLDIAARISAGRPFPDTRAVPNPVGSVLILSAEDDVADTIRPRLDAAQADVSRIYAIRGVQAYESDTETHRERLFCLDGDLAMIEPEIERLGDVRLLIVDPVTAYLGRTDSHKNAEVRAVLASLADLAMKHHLAVLCVSHLNKAAGGSAMYRMMGSLAFTAAARIVLAIVADREDPKRRLILPIKSNLSPNAPGLAYQLIDDGDGAAVHWDAEPVAVTADQALAPDDRRGPSAVEDAATWLREALSDGPLESKDVRRMATDAGHGWGSVRRAQEKAGVTVARAGFGKDGRWTWTIGAQSPPDAPNVQTLRTYGDPAHLCEDGPEGPLIHTHTQTNRPTDSIGAQDSETGHLCGDDSAEREVIEI